MALQGTIETFALPEVLRLLGSGAKTGRLRLSGDRGSGSVWIDGGKVVGAEAREGGYDIVVAFGGVSASDEHPVSPEVGSPTRTSPARTVRAEAGRS